MREVYSDSEVPMKAVDMNKTMEPVCEEECPPPTNPPAFPSDDDEMSVITTEPATSKAQAKQHGGKFPEAFAATYRRIGRSLSMVRASFSAEQRGLILKRCRSLADGLWMDAGTGKFSFVRVLQTTLIFAVLVFLINALAVTMAFWQASHLDPQQISFTSLSFTGLDQDKATFSLQGQLQDSFLMKHLHVELTKTTTCHLYLLPAEESACEPIKAPLASISIPAGTVIDPASLSISVSNVGISFFFNDRFPAASLSDLLRPRDEATELTSFLPLLPKVMFDIEYGVATKSFWIPLWFNGTYSRTIDLAESVQSALATKPRSGKKTRSFVDNLSVAVSNVSLKEAEEFEMLAKVSINHPQVPKNVNIDLPLLGMNVSSQHGLMFSASLPKQSIIRESAAVAVAESESVDAISLAVALNIRPKNKTAIKKFLYSLLNEDEQKDNIISFSGLKAGASGPSGFPKRAEKLNIELPVELLVSTLKTLPSKLSAVSELPQLPRDSPVAFFDLVGPSRSSPGSLELRVNVNTLPWSKLLPKWVWLLPVPTLKALITYQSAQRDLVEIAQVTLSRDGDGLSNDLLPLMATITLKETALTAIAEFVEDAHSMPLDGEESKLIISGSPECFLTSLLEPLSVTISHDFSIGFLHGKPDVLSTLMSATQTEMDLMTLTSPAFTDTIQHQVSIEASSTKDQFQVQSKIFFATDSVIELPHVHFSWRDFEVSLGSSSTELFKLTAKTGSTKLFLDCFKNPLALLHDGLVDVSVIATDSKSFIPAWFQVAKEFLRGRESKLPLDWTFASEKCKFSSKLFVPTADIFYRIFSALPVTKSGSLPATWAEWFKAFSSTDIKLTGFRGLTTQLMIALPQIEISGRPKPLDSVAFDVNLSLPQLSMNMCHRSAQADPFEIRDGKSRGINCVAEVGIHPVAVELKIVDGQLRSLKSSLVDDLNIGLDPKLPNLVPIGLTLLDLNGAFLILKDASELGWDNLTMSTGLLRPPKIRYMKPSMLDSAAASLLNRLVNALGALMPFNARQLTQRLHKIGIPTTKSVSHFYRTHPLKCNVDLKSPNRNLLVGEIDLALPAYHEATAKEINEVEHAASLPKSILVNMEWEDIALKLSHKTSYLSIHIPKGHAALNVQKLNGAITFDSQKLSRNLGFGFRLFMDGRHVSSLTLRQFVDQLSLWNGKQSKRNKKSKKYTKNIRSLVNNRQFKMSASIGTRTRINSALSLPVLLSLFDSLRRKLTSIMAKQLKVNDKSLKVNKLRSLPEVTIHPSPLQKSLHIPCLVPVLCHGSKHRNQALSNDLRLMKVKLRVSRVMQVVSDYAAHFVGLLIEKLALPQHPAFMNLKVKTSAISFGVAVNGIESLEVVVEPFAMERTSAIIYSGQISPVYNEQRMRAIRTDSFELVVYTALSPSIRDLQKIMSPIGLDPNHQPILQPLPEYARSKSSSSLKTGTEAHHLPIVISTQNLHTRHSSLLSSFISMSVPAINLGPLSFDMKKGSKLLKKYKLKPPRVILESSDGTNLNVSISRIRFPNPLPVSLVIDKKIVVEVQYRKYPFLRASLDGKKVRISAHESSDLSARVTLSKNAFGTNKHNGKVLLRDFISKLASGSPVAFKIVVRWGSKHSIFIPVSLGQREVSRDMFVAEKVDVDWNKVNDLVHWGSIATDHLGSVIRFLWNFIPGSNNSPPQATMTTSAPPQLGPRLDDVFASKEFKDAKRKPASDNKSKRRVKPTDKDRKKRKPKSSDSSSSSSDLGGYYMRFPRSVNEEDDDETSVGTFLTANPMAIVNHVDDDGNGDDSQVAEDGLQVSALLVDGDSVPEYCNDDDDDSVHEDCNDDDDDFATVNSYRTALMSTNNADFSTNLQADNNVPAPLGTFEPEVAAENEGWFSWLFDRADNDDSTVSSLSEYDQFGERLDYDDYSSDHSYYNWYNYFSFNDDDDDDDETSTTYDTANASPLASLPVPNHDYEDFPDSESAASEEEEENHLDAEVDQAVPLPALSEPRPTTTGLIPSSFPPSAQSKARKSNDDDSSSSSSFTIDSDVSPPPPSRKKWQRIAPSKQTNNGGTNRTRNSSSNSSSSSSSSSSSTSSSSSSDSDDSDDSSSTSPSRSSKRKTNIRYFYSTRPVVNDDRPVEVNGAADSTLLSQAGFAVKNVFTHARVRLVFRNPSEFPVYILGGKFNVEIDDRDLIWSRTTGGSMFKRSWFSQVVSVTMFFAPEPCRPKSLEGIKQLDSEAFLKCLEANRASPVSVILPEPAETEMSAFAYLNSALDNVQLLDEMFYHDGLCTSVVNSPLAIALDTQNGHPFVLDLMINVLKVPARPRPFSDPCLLETSCLPDAYYQHDLGVLARTRSDSCSSSSSSSQVRLDSPYKLATGANDGGQLWRQTPVDLNSDLVLSVRLESQYLSSMPMPPGLTQAAAAQKPSFGFVFSPTASFSSSGQGSFALTGLAGESVAVLLDPSSYAVLLVQNGNSVLMAKENGAFPTDLSEVPLLISLRHSPRQRKLILTVAPEHPPNTEAHPLKPYYYSTVFPVNLNSLFASSSGRVFAGLTATSGSTLSFTVSNWKLQSVLPRLEASTLYAAGKRKPARVHRTETLLLQLKDSCGRAINGIGMNGNLQLNVMLRKVANGLEHDVDSEDEAEDEKEGTVDADTSIKPDDYTIHHRPDRRPRQRTQTRFKLPRKLKPSNSLAAQPKEYHAHVQSIKYNPKYGLFEVKFKSVFSGRFEVYLAIQDNSTTISTNRRRKKRTGIPEAAIERHRAETSSKEAATDDDSSSSEDGSDSSSSSDSSNSDSSSASSISIQNPPFYWTRIANQELYIAPRW